METIRIMKNLWRGLLRVVKIVDFPVQTILLVGTLLLTFLDKERNLLSLMTGYLLIGPWQMFSALLFLIARGPFRSARKIHFTLSVVLLLLLFTIMWLPLIHEVEVSMPYWVGPVQRVYQSLFMVMPGLLALFYYGITGKWAFQKTETRGFLPHINF